ncbi:MAG: hypothetical protein V1697_02805 [Candidatus Levyibacteriota bacterium]
MHFSLNYILEKYKPILLIILVSVILRLIVFEVKTNNPSFNLQQDNYLNYATALAQGSVKNSNLSENDWRLFPGYPVMIIIVDYVINSKLIAALLINILVTIASIVIFWIITKKNIIFTALFSIFPPIWLYQSVKVSTEPVTLFLLLLSIFVFLKKKYYTVGLIIGMAFTVRLISISLLFALIFFMFTKKEFLGIRKIIITFLIGLVSFFLYNYLVFGQDLIFVQFIKYNSFETVVIGTTQIIKDIFRVLDSGQYRIFFSGMFYLSINLFALIGLYFSRHKSVFHMISLYWFVFSLLFIFSLSPDKLLEEFSRFTVPFVPALTIGIVEIVNKFIPKVKLNKYV